MSNTYSCIVCGSQRTTWKCIQCEQLEALKESNKISAGGGGGSSSETVSNGAGIDGTEWWISDPVGITVSSIIASIFTLWFIWDWTIHDYLYALIIKAFIALSAWIFVFMYWPIIIGIGIVGWLLFHLAIFLFTTSL